MPCLLQQSLQLARQKADQLKLPLKIVTVSRNEDNNLTFYFEAESRIDFRQLVQELNEACHENIRLEQIGNRDVVKKIGAIGPCGQKTCCKRFLTSFTSISNEMLTAQGLSCNPNQYTGMCGKLMCCLTYECPKEKLRQIVMQKEKKKARLAQRSKEPQSPCVAKAVTPTLLLTPNVAQPQTTYTNAGPIRAKAKNSPPPFKHPKPRHHKKPKEKTNKIAKIVRVVKKN